MARVTIEDCTLKVPNRFHLVKMASIRTKQLKKGATSLVGSEDNKEVVLSLREIAAGFVRPDYPEESEGAADSGLDLDTDAEDQEESADSSEIEANPDS